jgi:hypothetical protein
MHELVNVIPSAPVMDEPRRILVFVTRQVVMPLTLGLGQVMPGDPLPLVPVADDGKALGHIDSNHGSVPFVSVVPLLGSWPSRGAARPPSW